MARSRKSMVARVLWGIVLVLALQLMARSITGPLIGLAIAVQYSTGHTSMRTPI